VQLIRRRGDLHVTQYGAAFLSSSVPKLATS
jgi:hypothetical protein